MELLQIEESNDPYRLQLSSLYFLEVSSISRTAQLVIRDLMEAMRLILAAVVDVPDGFGADVDRHTLSFSRSSNLGWVGGDPAPLLPPLRVSLRDLGLSRISNLRFVDSDDCTDHSSAEPTRLASASFASGCDWWLYSCLSGIRSRRTCFLVAWNRALLNTEECFLVWGFIP